MSRILPAITLYQPWATWIMRGWKTIETRTHKKFSCLKRQTIIIHSGKTTDADAINNPYLSIEQLQFDPDEMINGFILGTAFVLDCKLLDSSHSQHALINCHSVTRYGLFLYSINKFVEPIPCKGARGIWYYDLDKKCKVKKNDIYPKLF